MWTNSDQQAFMTSRKRRNMKWKEQHTDSSWPKTQRAKILDLKIEKVEKIQQIFSNYLNLRVWQRLNTGIPDSDYRRILNPSLEPFDLEHEIFTVMRIKNEWF